MKLAQQILDALGAISDGPILEYEACKPIKRTAVRIMHSLTMVACLMLVITLAWNFMPEFGCSSAIYSGPGSQYVFERYEELRDLLPESSPLANLSGSQIEACGSRCSYWDTLGAQNIYLVTGILARTLPDGRETLAVYEYTPNSESGADAAQRYDATRHTLEGTTVYSAPTSDGFVVLFDLDGDLYRLIFSGTDPENALDFTSYFLSLRKNA